jgi:hypothetical protein
MSWYNCNTGYDNKLQSDRFENPNNMLCPLWSGQDNYGRPVNPDSYYTKNAGCNSAEDRVSVENFLRPDYMEYVALDAKGFRNPTMYSNNPPTMLYEGFIQNPSNAQAAETSKQVKDYYKIVGNAGYQLDATNTPYNNGVCGVSGNPGCNSCSGRNRANKQQGMYEGYTRDTQANRNFQNRMNQQFVQSFKSNNTHRNSDMTY